MRDMFASLTGDSKLAAGVNVMGRSNVSPTSQQMIVGIGSSATVPL